MQRPGIEGRREGLREVVLDVVVVGRKPVLGEYHLELRLAHGQGRGRDR